MRKAYDALSPRAWGLLWNRGWKQIDRTRGGRYLKTYGVFRTQQCYCTYEITANIKLNNKKKKPEYTQIIQKSYHGGGTVGRQFHCQLKIYWYLLKEKKSVFFKDVKMGRLKNSRADSYIQDELGKTNWTWLVYSFKKRNHIVLWGGV